MEERKKATIRPQCAPGRPKIAPPRGGSNVTKAKTFVVQWVVQFGKQPSDLLDERYQELCLARAKARGRSIAKVVFCLENPDDMTRRHVPDDELCQHCETRLAKRSKSNE